MVDRRWKIHFHKRCGRYITFLDDYQRARRENDTYDHGLVFSNRPLRPGELFQLKLEETESKWAGSLRIGVTTDNPNCDSTRIARAVTDLFTNDNENYWILSGDRVHRGKKEIEYKLNMHTLNVYDRIAVQVRFNGDLHFYQNGIDKGKAMSGVPVNKDIFAVFDVYGRTKQVSWEYYGVPTLEVICRKAIRAYMNEEEIEKILLPPTLKEFLKADNE